MRDMLRGGCISAVRSLALFGIENWTPWLAVLGGVLGSGRRNISRRPPLCVCADLMRVCPRVLLHRGSSPWQVPVQSIQQGRRRALAAFLGGMKGRMKGRMKGLRSRFFRTDQVAPAF